MNITRATLRSFVLLSAGIAAGAIGPSDFGIPLSGRGAEALLSFGPRELRAADNAPARPGRDVADFNEAFARIVDSAAPSVVTILSESSTIPAARTPLDLFGKSFRDYTGLSKAASAKGSVYGVGSGVIVSPDGYIVTNSHLIDNPDAVFVRTSDNRTLRAKVVGRDSKTDIAVLKVEASGMKPITTGNSDRLRTGEWVVAVGAPLGESRSRTATKGIVSSLGVVNVAPNEYEEFIQTDAVIDAANSGGPLLDIRGELVGIGTAASGNAAGLEGFGFALPSGKAMKVYQALARSGKVSRGYLGIGMQDVDAKVASQRRLESPQGIVVGAVAEQGAAADGLKRGDLITEFNGRKVAGTNELRAAVAGQEPGSSATVRVERDGAPVTVNVRVEQLTEKVASATGQIPEVENELLGFMASPLNAETAERMGKKAMSTRVVVTAVREISAAGKAGLRPGDVILSIDKSSITSFAHYNQLVGRKKRGDKITMLVERGWSRMYFSFNL
ncbi:MAG: PDZ domain-containing protein [Chlorobaculum sp.]|jgi:serine protease Do|nr:PDZ domain-containing protein [Chlorobaculum sp.]